MDAQSRLQHPIDAPFSYGQTINPCHNLPVITRIHNSTIEIMVQIIMDI